jgi:hypothetical protein
MKLIEIFLNAGTLCLAGYLLYQPVKYRLAAAQGDDRISYDYINEVLMDMHICMKHFDDHHCQAFNQKFKSYFSP